MRLTLRTVAAGIFLAALGAGGITIYHSALHGADPARWDGPEDPLGIADRRRRAEELDRKGDVILRRTAIRHEIVTAVLAGGIDVADAIEQFDRLNHSDPEILALVRLQYPGSSDRERAGRHLAGFLRASRHAQAIALADQAACLAVAQPVDG